MAFNQRERMAFNKKRRRFTDIYYKKNSRVSTGFTRVVRVPGRPGFAGPNPKLVFSLTRPGSRPGSIGSRIDPPGRVGF